MDKKVIRVTLENQNTANKIKNFTNKKMHDPYDMVCKHNVVTKWCHLLYVKSIKKKLPNIKFYFRYKVELQQASVITIQTGLGLRIKGPAARKIMWPSPTEWCECGIF